MHPLEQLEFTTRVAKRAQYEAFEFSITEAGVRVRNCSHEEPADHEYVVSVEDGLPTACDCPADERFDGACKHRVAVVIRKPVLEAVTATSVAADGGVDGEVVSESDLDVEDGDPDDCDCDELPGDFPCWECVRTGRRTIPDAG